jgi:hypothetical protein
MQAINIQVRATLYISKRDSSGNLIPVVRERVDSIQDAVKASSMAYAAGADHCNVILDIDLSDEDKQTLREAAAEAAAKVEAANEPKADEPKAEASVIDLAKVRALGHA